MERPIKGEFESKLPLPFTEMGIQAGFPSPAQDYFDKSLDFNKELWEEALKEEKLRIEYAKPISDNLKKYLHAHYEAVPIIKDIDNLKQGELEECLNSNDPQRNHFSIEGPEWNDDNKWKANYGFDKEFYCSPGADSYSEALEIGVIEFIEALYWKDENGRHLDEHFIIRDK